MKVEYENIIGQIVKRNLPCDDCCFSNLIHCIPYSIHRCTDHIFKEGETQIFNL